MKLKLKKKRILIWVACQWTYWFIRYNYQTIYIKDYFFKFHFLYFASINIIKSYITLILHFFKKKINFVNINVKYVYKKNNNVYNFCSYMIPFLMLIYYNYSCNSRKSCQQLQTLPTIAKVANNYRSCQQLQKLPTAAVVAEKGCNSGFKLVIAENLKTVANTNFRQRTLVFGLF